MNESALSAMQFAEELADLRRAVGSPSLREMARCSPGRKLAHSTAGDALKGDHIPSLQVVYSFVEACHEFARRNGIAVNDEDFARTKWHSRRIQAKKRSEQLTGNKYGDALLAALLAKRVDAGDDYAARRLAELLVERGDVEGLSRRADAGETAAAKLLAELLAERGDVEGLSWRAEIGDVYAADRLARIWAEEGFIEHYRERAAAGDSDTVKDLLRLTEQGDIERNLKRLADAGDLYAALAAPPQSDPNFR